MALHRPTPVIILKDVDQPGFARNIFVVRTHYVQFIQSGATVRVGSEYGDQINHHAQSVNQKLNPETRNF